MKIHKKKNNCMQKNPTEWNNPNEKKNVGKEINHFFCAYPNSAVKDFAVTVTCIGNTVWDQSDAKITIWKRISR